MENIASETSLWRASLGSCSSSNGDRLRSALAQFRDRVEKLLQPLGDQLPGLTVHDVTHLDALWRTASEIAGPKFELNPAEAFVLGGAILLHDAAHVVCAFEGGLSEIRETSEWKDLIAQDFQGIQPNSGSPEEKSALFQVLRHLHAKQAHRLATMSWPTADGGERLFLIPDNELRAHYGDLIGRIAESHHWPTHRVATEFRARNLPAPAFLQPDNWNVDSLKIALLLRTADAAHIDSLRAPMFLFALRNPKGISQDHWLFQSRLSQPTRMPGNKLLIASGMPFSASERKSWWLSYDTARMIDGEIRLANQFLLECGREQFLTSGVLDIDSPEAFAKHVPVHNWTPMDVRPKVGDIPSLVATLGGAALYGNRPWAALRELLQNAIDAIQALRGMGVIETSEGTVDVKLERLDGAQFRLTVEDNGIGMSKYVLTDVMLDFGRSLWSSPALREQLPGLAASGFSAIGKFGIGFFSVFMLGQSVSVVTRRFEIAQDDTEDQWSLQFEEGLRERPVLSIPAGKERLKRNGTRVSVALDEVQLINLLDARMQMPWDDEFKPNEIGDEELLTALSDVVSWIAPSANVRIRATAGTQTQIVAEPNDWLTAEEETLRRRVHSAEYPLFPLTDQNGRVLGRLGLGRSWSSHECAVTVKGVRNGSINGLAGVCEAAHNLTSAARMDAEPAGSKDDWRRWAETLLDGMDVGISDLPRLHSLTPQRDLALWTINGNQATAADVSAFLTTKKEVVLLHGFMRHDSSDDVAEHRFSGLEYELDVISCPAHNATRLSISFGEDYAHVAGSESLRYDAKFREIISRAWGDFEEYEEDEVVIGTIEGIEIFRTVNRFARA